MIFLLVVRYSSVGGPRRQPLKFLFGRAQLGIDRHTLVELFFARQPHFDPLDLTQLRLDRLAD
ncbi:hypothetical protein [Blastomonas sp. CCH1-A6]|uniref:hypothetical protein n=1 Tax=Blastomonas sp. CCH1-A6 TaxID=1768762 RepID=UPI00082E3862